jgi:hypothetical protein
MSDELLCYRCGAPLAKLTLPLSHRDQCPACSADLHVCRMCRYYDPAVPRQCREDGAEDVKEKERPNFCDWFQPATGAFDAGHAAASAAARDELAAMFGEGEAEAAERDPQLASAEDLFR